MYDQSKKVFTFHKGKISIRVFDAAPKPKTDTRYSVSLPGIELSNIKAINPAINICVLSSTTIKSSTTADPKKKQVPNVTCIYIAHI